MFDVRDPQPDPVWTVPYPPSGKVMVDAAFVAKVREASEATKYRSSPDAIRLIREAAALLPAE